MSGLVATLNRSFRLNPLPPMRLLCTGDLHLGRRSTRVPATLAAPSAASAWARIVELAVQREVDAVLLSGDVVDQENRYFEAVGPLERGLRTLLAAGIPAVAVAGNHDHDVLPALARTLPAGALQLLGSRGQWQRTTLVNARGERLHVDGWSFTARHEHDSPLAHYHLEPSPEVPVIGLLHGDLDAPTSAYAPITRDALRALPVQAWVLGHVHAGGRRERAGDPPVLYPGSPQPLDPGETDAHGVWMLDVSPDGAVRTVLHPIATVQYQLVSVALDDCAQRDDARERIMEALRDAVREMHDHNPLLTHAAVRLRLTGRSPLHGTLDTLADELRTLEDLGSASAFSNTDAQALSITHVELQTSAALDLAGLATRRDAVGMLARLLQSLERDGAANVDPSLWRLVQAVPASLRSARPYSGVVQPDAINDERLAERLSVQATRLLETLIAQQVSP